MRSQQVVALLSVCLTFNYVSGVVNNGQTKKSEEALKPIDGEKEKSKVEADLIADSSEAVNRREATSILDSYGTPQINLPVPIYGVPNAPSNNVVYPAPPPDIPPPPAPLYGTPSIGKTYGVPQVSGISKGFGTPLPVKYGVPSFTFNVNPPKALYGPPKSIYGPPSKPLKFHKYPPKNFGLRAPKPVYGAPLTFKDTFNYNKLNLNTNYLNGNSYSNLYSSNAFSNLYSGVSSLNHQYGAPVIPSKIQYGTPSTSISTQYGVPHKSIAYGPPQPSPNPKPPHPGAPAPPTPPDIKYDGWQPIPGLVSKRPIEDVHSVTGEGTAYNDLSPPPLKLNQISDTYGAPQITLDVNQGGSLLGQTGLSDSYGVPLKSVTGTKGVSDSYSAPLGTVTGSGGVVTSSGDEAHRAGSQESSHNLNLDLSSVGVGHGADIQASIEYDLGTQTQISDSYGIPQLSSQALNGYKSLPSVDLVPPSGQYRTSLHTSTSGAYKGNRQGLFTNTKGSLFSNSYLPPSHPVAPSTSYGVPSSGAISFQNVAHGSSSAGIQLPHSSISIEGANALPLTSYSAPSGSIDASYSLPASNDGVSVSLDFSHPPVTIDLTDGKQNIRDCYNKQQLQVPSLAYGVPSADSYTSSLSSLTTNIANSQIQTVVPQPTYGTPNLVPQVQYGPPPDLLHSSSIKSEATVNSVEDSDEAHGKSYGKSVAASFGPNSELLESQSIDLNNIALQGNLGSYTLQIQSADGTPGQAPHTQVLNEGLLQSILQAIEQPGKQGQSAQYPIILQPSLEQNYSINETVSDLHEAQQGSELKEVIIEAPKNNNIEDKTDNDNEETLQLLDTSNIALYFKKDDNTKKDREEKSDENNVDNDTD